MTQLVDLHGKGGVPDGVVYIGRAGRGGRPARSPLSNPFTVEQYGPDALRFCRLYLVNALATAEPGIVTELARLQQTASAGDLALGCWCCERPAFIEGIGGTEPDVRCHGDIVATMLEHWGVRLATFAHPEPPKYPTGPECWAAFVRREFGSSAHACLGMVFGSAELRAMADVSPRLASECGLAGVPEAIAAGMPKWMRR